MKLFQFVVSVLFLCSFGCRESADTLHSARPKDALRATKPESVTDAIVVFRSSDGGQTWLDISEGLPGHVEERYGAGRNVSFATDSGFYLTYGSVLYHSNPGSGRPFWTKTRMVDAHSSIVPGKAGIIAFHNEGGFSRQVNGSDQWMPVFANFKQKGIRSVLESSTGSVFIGTDDGLFKSGDNGQTWKKVHSDGQVVKVVEWKGVLMAINNRSIIRSANDGEHWDSVVREDRRGFVAESIRDGFAIGLDRTATDSRRVRSSHDGGRTWQAIEAGLPADRLMTSFVQVGEDFFCSHPRGIFKSSDKGGTWELILPSVEDRIFHLYVSGSVMYAVPRKRGC